MFFVFLLRSSDQRFLKIPKTHTVPFFWTQANVSSFFWWRSCDEKGEQWDFHLPNGQFGCLQFSLPKSQCISKCREDNEIESRKGFYWMSVIKNGCPIKNESDECNEAMKSREEERLSLGPLVVKISLLWNAKEWNKKDTNLLLGRSIL